MFLKSLFILIIFVPMAFAGEVAVSEGLKKYTLNHSDIFLELKDPSMTLSLVKKSCNERMVKKFNSQVKLMLKKMTKQVQPIPEGIKLSVGSDEFYTSLSTPAGKFFHALPDEIKRLKIEESLRCEPKK